MWWQAGMEATTERLEAAVGDAHQELETWKQSAQAAASKLAEKKEDVEAHERGCVLPITHP